MIPLRLNPREREIAGWIAQGESPRSIAIRLALSLRTIEAQIQVVLAKLGIERVDEVAEALRRTPP